MKTMLGRRGVLTMGALTLMTGAGGLLHIDDAAAAEATVTERRAALYALLGDLPARRRPVNGQKTSEAERDGYVLERWTLDLNGICSRRPTPRN
jgi:hypothetical protein